MRRTFKIMLIAGVIATIGGVIYITGEALWDKGNAVGPRPARRLHRQYRLLKPLAAHSRLRRNSPVFWPRRRPWSCVHAWEEPLTPSAFRKDAW